MLRARSALLTAAMLALSAQAAAETRFVELRVPGSDGEFAIARGTVSLTVFASGVTYRNEVEIKDHLHLQVTVDGKPQWPLLEGPGPLSFELDTSALSEGSHAISLRVLEVEGANVYRPFPRIIVVDNVPGAVTGAHRLPICPYWITLSGQTPGAEGPLCDQICFAGRQVLPRGTPRTAVAGMPFSEVPPDEDLFQEDILGMNPLFRSEHGFFRTTDDHIVAAPMGSKLGPGASKSRYAAGLKTGLALPMLDGPRNRGWVSVYITGAVHPVTESLIFAELGGRVGRIDLDGRVTTIAGWRTRPDIVSTTQHDEHATEATHRAERELVGTFVDGPEGFSAPSDVAIDRNDPSVLYVADSGNHRIVRIDTKTSPATVTTYAGSRNGTAGYADGPSEQARFSEPFSVTINDDGVLYVADRQNNCIRAVDRSGKVTTVAGHLAVNWPGPTFRQLSISRTAAENQHDFLVDGPIGRASVVFPMVIRLDSRGRIILGEDYTHALRRVDFERGVVETINAKPPSGGDGVWIWLDVDREGTFGPRDDIIWAASVGGAPKNEQFYRISPSGAVSKLNSGLRFKFYEGRWSVTRIPHYPWLVAVGNGALWLNGFGGDGLVRLRKARDNEIVDSIRDPSYNIYRYGLEVYMRGTARDFPEGVRPSLSLLHGARGETRIGTLKTFDELAELDDAALGALIRAGFGGSQPRPEISGRDLRDLIYFIRRNSLLGVTSRVEPGPDPDDEHPPTVTDVVVTELPGYLARVEWQTSETAIGLVRYGKTADYSQHSSVGMGYSTRHQATIGPLRPQTPYYVAVQVRDEAGNSTTTRGQTITITGRPCVELASCQQALMPNLRPLRCGPIPRTMPGEPVSAPPPLVGGNGLRPPPLTEGRTVGAGAATSEDQVLQGSLVDPVGRPTAGGTARVSCSAGDPAAGPAWWWSLALLAVVLRRRRSRVTASE